MMFYEKMEEEQEFKDEFKFGKISYLDFLNRVDNGSVKLEELGIKLYVLKM
jgi:hypothetical protein